MESQRKSVFSGDLIITLVIAGVCLYMLGASESFKFLSKLFPRIIAGATLLACIAQMVFAVRKARTAQPKKSAKTGAGAYNHLAIIAVTIAYIVALPFLGFIICTVALMVSIPLFLGYRNKVVIAVLALALTLSFYLVFKTFFYVPLPQGILTFI